MENLGSLVFKLWDLEARKIACNHGLFFNEDKIHKKPVKKVEIRRVIFQEDGHVHKHAQVDGQIQVPQG